VGGPIVRAASMTLVVPVEDEAQADALTELLDDLTWTHPCRAIVLMTDERVDEPRARLAGHPRRGTDGEAPRYWEEIRMVAASRALHQVMSSVTTLLLPNVPVQAWWPREPELDGDLHNQLLDVADRVVVDSSRFADPMASLPGLAASIAAAHESIAFADLSWTRLTPWRSLTAAFFDAPSDQALLDSLHHVAVEYVPGAGGEPAQALLFLGWLASRLGWEPRGATAAGPGAWQLEMVDGVRPVHVEVRPGADATPGLRMIAIEATEAGRRGTYTIERCGDGQEAHTIAEGDGGRLEGRARLPVQTEVELLREELGGFATDQIYQEALALAARLFSAR
jgi:glucose-6-phosphate dehydrogenase assembly protein OpcA